MFQLSVLSISFASGYKMDKAIKSSLTTLYNNTDHNDILYMNGNTVYLGDNVYVRNNEFKSWDKVNENEDNKIIFEKKMYIQSDFCQRIKDLQNEKLELTLESENQKAEIQSLNLTIADLDLKIQNDSQLINNLQKENVKISSAFDKQKEEIQDLKVIIDNNYKEINGRDKEIDELKIKLSQYENVDEDDAVYSGDAVIKKGKRTQPEMFECIKKFIEDHLASLDDEKEDFSDIVVSELHSDEAERKKILNQHMLKIEGKASEKLYMNTIRFGLLYFKYIEKYGISDQPDVEDGHEKFRKELQSQMKSSARSSSIIKKVKRPTEIFKRLKKNSWKNCNIAPTYWRDLSNSKFIELVSFFNLSVKI